MLLAQCTHLLGNLWELWVRNGREKVVLNLEVEVSSVPVGQPGRVAVGSVLYSPSQPVPLSERLHDWAMSVVDCKGGSEVERAERVSKSFHHNVASKCEGSEQDESKSNKVVCYNESYLDKVFGADVVVEVEYLPEGHDEELEREEEDMLESEVVSVPLLGHLSVEGQERQSVEVNIVIELLSGRVVFAMLIYPV